MPRFDGLYFYSRDGYSHWLRFWPDRAVMSATTTPAGAAQIASWLRMSNPDPWHPRGRWTKRGKALRFNEAWEDEGETSEVTNVAAEEGDVLSVAWTNARLGKSGKAKYRFIPLPPEDLDGPR